MVSTRSRPIAIEHFYKRIGWSTIFPGGFILIGFAAKEVN